VDGEIEGGEQRHVAIPAAGRRIGGGIGMMSAVP